MDYLLIVYVSQADQCSSWIIYVSHPINTRRSFCGCFSWVTEAAGEEAHYFGTAANICWTTQPGEAPWDGTGAARNLGECHGWHGCEWVVNGEWLGISRSMGVAGEWLVDQGNCACPGRSPLLTMKVSQWFTSQDWQSQWWKSEEGHVQVPGPTFAICDSRITLRWLRVKTLYPLGSQLNSLVRCLVGVLIGGYRLVGEADQLPADDHPRQCIQAYLFACHCWGQLGTGVKRAMGLLYKSKSIYTIGKWYPWFA